MQLKGVRETFSAFGSQLQRGDYLLPFPISYQLYISSIDSLWHGAGAAMVQEISFIHEKTERSQASGEDLLTFLSLFGTSVLVHGLDDLGDGSPRRDVRGRLLLHDLVGEVVGPRPEVVSPRHDVLGRVRERDLGLLFCFLLISG